MPISLTPFSAHPEYEGCEWKITDIDVLAQWIAWVAVGQSYHVSNILHNVGVGPLPTHAEAIKEAVKLLTQAGKSPDHRDGWMFQIMSWLAAHKRTPNALIAAPHMIHAEKGLDGLEIILDANQKVTGTVIFEDKATVNARSTVRDLVWPEFKEFEDGAAVSRMSQAAAGILAVSKHPDPSQAVSAIVWKSSKRYRLSITTKKSTPASRKSLFKGYSTTVPGAVERRRGEIFPIKDLRPWMATLADLAIAHAKKMSTT